MNHGQSDSVRHSQTSESATAVVSSTARIATSATRSEEKTR